MPLGPPGNTAPPPPIKRCGHARPRKPENRREKVNKVLPLTARVRRKDWPSGEGGRGELTFMGMSGEKASLRRL